MVDYTDADVLTVKEVSELLNISAAAVYKLIDSGTLKYLDYSAPKAHKRTVRIRYKDLKDFVASRENARTHSN